MEQQIDFKSGTEYVKAVYCHSAHLTYIEYTTRNSGLEEVQAGIKIARININNLRYAEAETPILWQPDLKN